MKPHKSHLLAAELEAENCPPEVRTAAAAELRRLHGLMVHAIGVSRRHKERIQELKAKLYGGLTDDFIVKLARESGEYQSDRVMTPQALHRFKVLVAAAEREACAQVCDAASEPRKGYGQTDEQWAASTLAERIRARSQA